ncbi:MAG: hypothetical protein AVDCRST_MAG91-2864, partial [uncultured Sphingomonadaceae bacterium]
AVGHGRYPFCAGLGRVARPDASELQGRPAGARRQAVLHRRARGPRRARSIEVVGGAWI